MFAHLLPYLRRPPSAPSDTLFVREVNMDRPMPRNRRSEFWLIAGWALVVLKAAGTFWLVEHYRMPFNPWWIVLPTIVAAVTCTWIYWRRN